MAVIEKSKKDRFPETESDIPRKSGADFSRNRSENAKRHWVSKWTWRLAELADAAQTKKDQKTLKKSLAALKKLDESDKFALESASRAVNLVIESIKDYIAASELYAGSADKSWCDLLKEAEETHKMLMEKQIRASSSPKIKLELRTE